MTSLYGRMKIYNPDLTLESYQSLIDALKTERDRVLGTRFISVITKGGKSFATE